MSDYIDRDELIKHINDLPTWWGDGSGVYTFYPVEVMVSIANAPAADVQEVRHGEWKQTNPTDEDCYCSVCGYDALLAIDMAFHYCPNCGAKMDGGAK